MKNVIDILVYFPKTESDLSCNQAEMKFQFRYNEYYD